MTIKDNEQVDLVTPSGPMRTYVFRPSAPGRYPGIVLYSEIFQVTGPIRRTAAMIAGHGFVVAVPEIYHEFEPAGTVLAYLTALAFWGKAGDTVLPLLAVDVPGVLTAWLLFIHLMADPAPSKLRRAAAMINESTSPDLMTLSADSANNAEASIQPIGLLGSPLVMPYYSFGKKFGRITKE